jgi:hypothetical protein
MKAMRCLFCKLDSSESHSEEHIIPESLGNRRHTLRPGIVCDGCNNYFSREVEKPFLESEAISSLRFQQGIGSKRGKVPSTSGLIFPPRVPVKVRREPFPDHRMLHLDIEESDLSRVLEMEEGRLLIPFTLDFPSGPVLSRFIAKLAVEAMADRLENFPEGLEYLVNESQLDLIRNHARRGTTPSWPVNQRQIYDRGNGWVDESGAQVQVLHEYDILMTQSSEWYFVVALFGTELAINYGGTEIDGYHRWLAENDNVSPLYCGRNSNSMKRLPWP